MSYKLFMPREVFGRYINPFIKEFCDRYKVYPEYAGKCLCEVEDRNLIGEHNFLHPHPYNYECCMKIGKVIQENPEFKFYLFAMGGNGKKRISYIGHFPNLIPIRTIIDLDRIFGKDLEKVKV